MAYVLPLEAPPTRAPRPLIPVAAPLLRGHERDYVEDCLRSNWISSTGQYVERFETAFAGFCGVKHAMTCCNGTAALHLALLALGVQPGDEVIIPSLTFVATANAVAYCGATPVFVDSEADTWNIDLELVERAIRPRTKGIVVVHLYGHPVDMDAALALARRHGLFVLEDAAEAHGAECRGRVVGSIGDAATFSFYGNKIITTGEGGMVTTNDDRLAAKVRQLRGQGTDPARRYWFPVMGYNYRMTNIEAAIGLAQFEEIDWHIARRRENASWYREFLRDVPGLQLPVEKPWARNVYWMTSVVLTGERRQCRDEIMARLYADGIETRPFFYPMHVLPMYRQPARGQAFPVAERLAAHGINLPSSAALSRSDIRYVSERLQALIERDAEW